MADQNVKIYFFGIKISTRRFPRQLITNLSSKCKNLLYSDENYYSGVFKVADYEIFLKTSKFKTATLDSLF